VKTVGFNHDWRPSSVETDCPVWVGKRQLLARRGRNSRPGGNRSVRKLADHRRSRRWPGHQTQPTLLATKPTVRQAARRRRDFGVPRAARHAWLRSRSQAFSGQGVYSARPADSAPAAKGPGPLWLFHFREKQPVEGSSLLPQGLRSLHAGLHRGQLPGRDGAPNMPSILAQHIVISSFQVSAGVDSVSGSA